MVKPFALIALFFMPVAAWCQLGSNYKKVMKFIDTHQIKSTKVGGHYITQDIYTGPREITTIVYKDSVAVMVSFMRKDSFFSIRDISKFNKENVPKYRAQIKCMERTTTYHYDTVHRILLMINYNTDSADPKINGFAATTDPELILNWTRGLTAWIKE